MIGDNPTKISINCDQKRAAAPPLPGRAVAAAAIGTSNILHIHDPQSFVVKRFNRVIINTSYMIWFYNTQRYMSHYHTATPHRFRGCSLRVTIER